MSKFVDSAAGGTRKTRSRAGPTVRSLEVTITTKCGDNV
jgi:hypothetical protein